MLKSTILKRKKEKKSAFLDSSKHFTFLNLQIGPYFYTAWATSPDSCRAEHFVISPPASPRHKCLQRTFFSRTVSNGLDR